MKKILMVLFLLMMVCVSDESTQGIDMSVESLRGLKGVFVEIEDLNQDIVAYGLKKDQIKTDVELKLRLAGIKILSEDEWLKEPGHPALDVNINSIKDDEYKVYAYNVLIELMQLVYLERNTEMFTVAATWVIGMIGTVETNQVVDKVRDTIKDSVDIFINDYLSVNPK